MFNGCYNLNQNIQIPNSVTNTAYMFNGCYNLNQNIQIPNSITNIAYMFNFCRNISNITIFPKNRTSKNTTSFIRNANITQLNIWTDNNTAINIMNTNFIQGSIKPTMTTIENGYYNSLYNVYIYTNIVF